MQVKQTLSKDNHKLFKQMTADYKGNLSFEELLLMLEQLFMSENKNKELFLGKCITNKKTLC